MEALKLDGIWWIPGQENVQVAGTMEFQPSGKSVLTLIGAFSDLESFDLDIPKFDIINGLTVDGRKVTLYDCHRSSARLSFPGVMSEEYHVSIVLLGHHFQSKEDVVFDRINVSFTNLDDWLGYSGLQCRHLRDGGRNSLAVTYDFPSTVEADVNGTRISVDFTCNVNMNLVKTVTITERKSFKIQFPSYRHIEELLHGHLLHNLRNFLSFGLAKPTYILTLTGSNSGITEGEGDHTREVEVSIIFEQRFNAVEDGKVHPDQMLFQFHDVQDSFQEKISAWLLKADKLQPVYSLYFGPMYQPKMYTDFQFLSLIQAIETYHRRTYGGEFLSAEKFADVLSTMISAIPEGLPGDYVNNVRDRLKYSNDLSLRRRLKDLFRELGEILHPFIPDTKDFVQKVLDTRNYLTHYPVELEEKALKGIELYEACLKLIVILQACLLKEMNFSVSDIGELLNRHYSNHFWFREKL
jgi:hypothetical protein